MSAILEYPLYWPIGWPRTKRPISSRFSDNLTTSAAKNQMIHEIELMGGRQIVITTNIPLKKSGSPIAGRKAPDDKGVAVYFQLKGEPKVFACDKWTRIMDNMRAITKTIEAIRGIERWGSSEILERIYRGFQALPEKSLYNESAWWVILGIDQDSTLDEIKAAYRSLIKTSHPDVGGSAEQFAKISAAFEKAKLYFEANGQEAHKS